MNNEHWAVPELRPLWKEGMKTDTKDLLDAALGYAERGWHVFPLTPGTSIPVGNCPDCRTSTNAQGVRTAQHKAETCACVAQGKPCHGVRAATLNARRIARWWSDRPYGIGIACGASGLVVMDCDAHGGEAPAVREEILPHRPGAVIMRPRNGIDVFTMLAVHHNDANAHWSTLGVFTPREGLHLIFSAEDAMDFRPDASASLGWQLDVKSAWSYVVAPPTVKPNGTYRWVDPSTPIRPLPGWLRGELIAAGRYQDPTTVKVQTPGTTMQGEPRKTYTRDQVVRAFHTELSELASTTKGSINERLNRAAFSLGKFVAAGEATYNDVAKLLVAAAAQAVAAKGIEWNEELAWATAQRGLDAGIVHKM